MALTLGNRSSLLQEVLIIDNALVLANVLVIGNVLAQNAISASFARLPKDEKYDNG